MLLATHPYWTDYVSAFGAAVGILVAGAAFVVAFRSARDARRSADSSERTAHASAATLQAANEQLALVRGEHERMEAERRRKPDVKGIQLSAIDPRPGEQAPPGVFRVGFANTGDRELQDALLTILFVPGSAAGLTDRWGNPESGDSKDETRERWPGVEGPPREFDYFARRVSIQVGVASTQYVRIPHAGLFPIRVKLFHAGLTGGGPWTDRWIDVDDKGTAVIIDITDEGSRGPFNGRHADFDTPPAD
jgi:hypothetical protein